MENRGKEEERQGTEGREKRRYARPHGGAAHENNQGVAICCRRTESPPTGQTRRIALISRACRSGYGGSRSRCSWNRTRCTCWHLDHGGACALASVSTPSHRRTSRTIRSASRRRGARASSLGCGGSQNHMPCCRNICILCSCLLLLYSRIIPHFRQLFS